MSTTEKTLSEVARDLTVKLRRDVAEAIGGGYYSTGAAKTVSVSASAFINLTELVVKLAERVEKLEHHESRRARLV